MGALGGYGQGILQGMKTTLEHFFKPKVTVEYPEEKIPLAPRFRGAPTWVFDTLTGRSRCVGCGLCVLACPKGVIEMRTTNGPGGVRFVDYYAIHVTRCLFCALCVEACPFRAIEMSHEFELAQYERYDLVYTRDEWLGRPAATGRGGDGATGRPGDGGTPRPLRSAPSPPSGSGGGGG